MEKINKELFDKWAKQSHWLKVNELPTPDGCQEIYLTPSGGLRTIIYDLEGNFFKVGSLGPPDPQGPPSNLLKGHLPFMDRG